MDWICYLKALTGVAFASPLAWLNITWFRLIPGSPVRAA